MPVLADTGGIYQRTPWFEKGRDESESFRGDFVDGYERVPDGLRPPGDIGDP